MNKSVIQQKLEQLKTYVDALQPFSQLTLADYLSDELRQRAIERRLQLCTQLCLEIATELVAHYGLPGSERPEELFIALGREDKIPSLLAQRLANMMRFRAHLLHDTDTDPLKVHAVLVNSLDVFPTFSMTVRMLVEEEPD